MRLAVQIFAFLLAGMLSVLGAWAAVGVVEDLTHDQVDARLLADGHDWADVQTDGLQVILSGQAPSEALRFRALAAAAEVVDASRVIDDMQIASLAEVGAPDFSIEFLKTDQNVTIIGLVPEGNDPELIGRRTARAVDLPVANFLGQAEFDAPDGWENSLAFAIEALGQLAQSKISLSPELVLIRAVAADETAREQIETELRSLIPTGVAADILISVPRPVIAPYAFRATLAQNGAQLETCASPTAETRIAILSAVAALPNISPPTCRIGLGVPSRQWGQAVIAAVQALRKIETGTLNISDTEISLRGGGQIDQSRFDAAIAELRIQLPDVFVLSASQEAETDDPVDGAAQPARFTANLGREGRLLIAGHVRDGLGQVALESLSRAEFGAEVLRSTLTYRADLPTNWEQKLTTGLMGLGQLSHGVLTVLPNGIHISGETNVETTSANLSQQLREDLGDDQDIRLDITFIAPDVPIVESLTPEECVAEIARAQEAEGAKLRFQPGSVNLDRSSIDTINRIVKILRLCPGAPIEIAGHTDSQGREEMNLNLSQARAESVLASLRQRRLLVKSFVARGYGETQPIADNDSEEGREANRRITFGVVDPDALRAAENPSAAPQQPTIRPRGRDDES